MIGLLNAAALLLLFSSACADQYEVHPLRGKFEDGFHQSEQGLGSSEEQPEAVVLPHRALLHAGYHSPPSDYYFTPGAPGGYESPAVPEPSPKSPKKSPKSPKKKSPPKEKKKSPPKNKKKSPPKNKKSSPPPKNKKKSPKHG